ncbi:ATP-binding cassette domain-containing protein [Tomitella biformata]|uniref:ATP-binding cassette domain-containing protein n=1 Tax=Tomitella biformata TaxID=630403 RepID=UPI00046690FC|nr:FHA domain-containing protein [Tomitella biformata]
MNWPIIRNITIAKGGVQRSFEPSGPVTVGRDGAREVVVDHHLVSRFHAQLVWRDGWLLSDAGSTNGTFIGGLRVVDAVRVDRQLEIRLGDPHTGPLLRLSVTPQAVGPPMAMPMVDVTAMATPNSPPADRSGPVTLTGAIPVSTRGVTIGRIPGNDIVLADVLVSRQHCRLVSTPAGVELQDLQSANGTFVNGWATRQARLNDRDVITVGNEDLLFAGGAIHRIQRGARDRGLHLMGVGFTVAQNKRLLVDVTIDAEPGSLTALIGPSGAGKSTLARVISGSSNPTEGVVLFEGHDLHAEFPALRGRIGLVPQDDVLHRQLTVRQALNYAAELRLPVDTSPADRDQAVAGVLGELSLTGHADTRVDRLSGGQRKRASVALELLTGPSLLILDEPTSGLDPALDRQVMVMLRELADAGRVVIVVTHSVAHLDMCDQVLLLAPGGKTAYFGSAKDIGKTLGVADWADIFVRVSSFPDDVFAAYRARRGPRPALAPPRAGAPRRPPTIAAGRQLSTIARRQVRLILADRGYLVFLAALPFVLGILALVVPGNAGFGLAGQGAPTEAMQIMVLLILGAAFMGSSLSIRDLVGERSIYLRERAVGLSPVAYLSAKTAVFCGAAVLQSLVLMAIVFAGKGLPDSSALLPSGAFELFVGIAVTASCCVTIGLMLSAFAKSAEQVMPLLVVAVMAQLVMCGGLIPVTGRAGLEQLSWLFPARWGFAAGASTVDLRANVATTKPDVLWQSAPGIWVLAIGMLLVLSAAFSAVTLRRLKTVARV